MYIFLIAVILMQGITIIQQHKKIKLEREKLDFVVRQRRIKKGLPL